MGGPCKREGLPAVQRLCVESKGEGGGCRLLHLVFYPSSLSLLSAKYSTKEDKYEEEIKLLTDKLKEVRGDTASPGWGGEWMEDLALKGLQCVLSARPLACRQAGMGQAADVPPPPQQQPRKEEAQ